MKIKATDVNIEPKYKKSVKYYNTGKLPMKQRFINMGKAKLVHDYDGFKLEGNYNGEDYCIRRSAIGMNGLHVEYDYVYVRQRSFTGTRRIIKNSSLSF